MDYTYNSSLLERGNNVGEVGYKTSIESIIASTFNQSYHTFLVGHAIHDVDVGKLLPSLSTVIFFNSWNIYNAL